MAAYDNMILLPTIWIFFIMKDLKAIGVNETEYSYDEVISTIAETRRKLIKDYPSYNDDSGIAPPPKGSDISYENGEISITTNVTVSVHVERIVEMDVDQQALTVVLAEIYAWYDESMIWNVSDVMQISMMTHNSSQLWTPHILYIEVLDYEALYDEEVAYVYSNGVVFIIKRTQFTIPCAVNIHNFPFDVHNCTITAGFIADYARIRVMQSDWIATHYERSNYSHLEWLVIDTNMKIEDDGEAYTVTLRLQRQGLFYATVLLFPLTLLNFMSLVIFILPLNGLERENFALTLILTYFVFIMVIIESSPPTGFQMPKLGLYIMLCTALMVISLGMSLLLTTMYDHCRVKKQKMPKTLSNFIEGHCNLAKIFETKYIEEYTVKLGLNEVCQNKENNMYSGTRKLDYDQFKTTGEYDGFKWRVLSNKLNMVFFFVMLLAHVVLPLVMFLHSH